MAPEPCTSKPKPEHKVYPYLLRGVSIVRPNQVWSSDITYIRLAHGFAYLTVVLDWYSRCVLSWRITASPRYSTSIKAANTPAQNLPLCSSAKV